MDWLHCNNCNCQYVQDRSPFVLTSCTHIFCWKCVSSGATKDACSVCKTAKVNWVEVTPRTMEKPEIGVYFKDKYATLHSASNLLSSKLDQQTSLVQKLTETKIELMKTLDGLKEEREMLESKLKEEQEWLRQDEASQLEKLDSPPSIKAIDSTQDQSLESEVHEVDAPFFTSQYNFFAGVSIQHFTRPQSKKPKGQDRGKND